MKNPGTRGRLELSYFGSRTNLQFLRRIFWLIITPFQDFVTSLSIAKIARGGFERRCLRHRLLLSMANC